MSPLFTVLLYIVAILCLVILVLGCAVFVVLVFRFLLEVIRDE